MASATPIRPKSPKILIVEDEAGLRSLVADILEDDGGFRLLMAGSADEAFDILMLNGDVACVFTDIRMPGKRNGIDLARGVLSTYPGVKVLITSGDSLSAPPVDGVPFLPKPYDLLGLPERLREVIAA